MSKITIIGAGSVGSTIAYTIAVTGLASEIVMLDINEDKALGEAMDIRQGTPFCASVNIYAGDYRSASKSDIVIITSGTARKPGQSRLDLAQTNVNVIKDIIPKITKYAPDAVYIIVSNPVDVLTYVFTKTSGLPEHRVIGSGTILDTARLRSRLSDYFAISQNNIHAYIFGEHGDTSFVPWSISNLPSLRMNEYYDGAIKDNKLRPKLDREEIEKYIKTSGAKIIERKGATYYAVAVSVCHICKCISSGTETAITVSTMMHGEYGINDVCLSTLNLVGKGGVRGKIMSPLSDEEIGLLHKSADSLKSVISNLDI